MSLIQEKTTVKLTRNSEWRFEVDFTQELTLKVLSGIVEMNGTELPNNHEIKLKGMKSFVYCFEAAELEYYGTLTSEYVSEESMVPQYVALNFAIENQRTEGLKPRVLVLGAKDSGKTTVIKQLVSYALKMDKEPLFVNLNPADGTYSVPGTLLCNVVTDFFDVENNWGESLLSGISNLNQSLPLVKYFGFDTADKSPEMYSQMCNDLAQIIDAKVAKSDKLAADGVFIDTPPVGIKQLDSIESLIAKFKANIVIVIDNERLFISLQRKKDSLGVPNLHILKLAKSGGCVDKDEAFLRSQQQAQIKHYFYGVEKKIILSPFTITNVSYDKLSVFKVTSHDLVKQSDSMDISSVLPIGEAGTEPQNDSIFPMDDDLDKNHSNGKSDGNLLEKIEPASSYLQNSLIAFTFAPRDATPEQILHSSVNLFGYIRDANDAKKKCNILFPHQDAFPEGSVLIGMFKYVD